MVSLDGPEHWMTLLAKSYDMWLQPVGIEPADLKKISIPVLVMAGDHDFSSVEDNAEIFRDLPNGQLIIVPGATTERSTSARSWSISQYASFWTNPILARHHTSSVAIARRSTRVPRSTVRSSFEVDCHGGFRAAPR